MFKVQEHGPQCSEHDIAEFERFIHSHLPSDYRAFLLKWNRCIPGVLSDTYHSTVKLPGGNEVTVEVFYSLSRTFAKLGNLHKKLESNVGIVSHQSIPIGHDSFGNLICLDCETGNVSWLLMESRFTFDLHRDFDLGIPFGVWIESLGPGPYAQA
jgi:hypothetical protein